MAALSLRRKKCLRLHVSFICLSHDPRTPPACFSCLTVCTVPTGVGWAIAQTSNIADEDSLCLQWRDDDPKKELDKVIQEEISEDPLKELARIGNLKKKLIF